MNPTFFLSTLVSCSETSSCSLTSLTLPLDVAELFPPGELIFFSCCTRLSFSSSSRESFSRCSLLSSSDRSSCSFRSFSRSTESCSQ